MTFGSLFAGIGGLDLGLERAGMACRWQVEIDPFCRRVLARHWPDVPRYEDVREVGARNLEPVDWLVGGFPCQDLSYAGRGAGLQGDRSGLFYEIARIAGEMEPGGIVLENVPALLARGLGEVLGTLASLGYHAWWDVLPAAAVGANHLRERAFVVAHTDSGRLQGIAHTRSPRPVWPFRAEQPQRLLESEGRLGVPTRSGSGIHDGLPYRVDALRALGNAVVPQVAEWLGRRIMEADAQLREAA